VFKSQTVFKISTAGLEACREMTSLTRWLHVFGHSHVHSVFDVPSHAILLHAASVSDYVQMAAFLRPQKVPNTSKFWDNDVSKRPELLVFNSTVGHNAWRQQHSSA